MQTLIFILYIVLALLILLVMITIHELGHYLAGKLLKFKINEFAIGFGPKLFSRKNKKTGEVFSLRAVPLGGFCAFEGEDGSEEEGAQDGENKETAVFDEVNEKDNKQKAVTQSESYAGKSVMSTDLKRFNDHKPWKRIVVFVAGGMFNILSAIIFSMIFIAAVGLEKPPVIAYVYTDEAGIVYNTDIKAGDRIVGVNGRNITYMYTFNDAVLDVSNVSEFTVEIWDANGKKQRINIKADDKIVEINGHRLDNPYPVSEAYFEARSEDISTLVINRTVSKNKTEEILLKTTDKVIKLNRNKIKYDYMVGDVLVCRIKFTLERTANNKTEKIEAIVTAQQIAITEENLAEMEKYWETPEEGYKPFKSLGYIRKIERDRGLGTAIKYSVPYTGKMSWLILGSLGKLVTGKVPLSQITGPVGTITVMAEASIMNWRNILILLPLIAANLGIFNLLPIPALDGSKIVFAGIEWIRKKPVNRKVEGMIHLVGLLLLFGFVIIADIAGIFLRC